MNEKISNDKINDLIGGLCQDLTPVKKRCPYRTISLWLILSALYMTGIILFLGVQVDLSAKITDAAFLFEMTMATAIFMSSALAASWLSFPDCAGKDWIKYVALTLFGSFMLWIFSNAVEEGMNFFETFTFKSCSRGLIVEALPFIALVLLSARGHSTKPYWLMTMTVLAVSSIGWIGLRLTCSMYDSMLYGFVHYFLPFAVIGVAVGFFARKIFRW